MPKMKTNRSAAKRFRLTGSGKIMRRKAFMNHMLEHKPSTRTRRLAKDVTLAPGDDANVRKMLGI